jgi:hypothetical protein
MNSDNVFRSREEELARLNGELAEIRGLMRDASARLNQIERHVRRAFGVQESPKQTPSSPKEAGGEHPSISPEEALEQFREMTDLSRDKGSTAVEERLGQMSIPNLKLMAHELGVSFSSKPSRKNLHSGIRGRISESVMLSPNRNEPTARSDQDTIGYQRENGSPATDEPDKK